MHTKGGGGVENPENFADVLYVWSLTSFVQVERARVATAAVAVPRFVAERGPSPWPVAVAVKGEGEGEPAAAHAGGAGGLLSLLGKSAGGKADKFNWKRHVLYL